MSQIAKHVHLAASQFLLLSFLGLLSGCGNGNSTTPTPNPVSVTISPTSATLESTTTQQFRATVTNMSNTAVVWQVNGMAGGDATAGTISLAGLYTAPTNIPATTTVTISAVAQADSTKSAAAMATVFAAPRNGVRVIAGLGEFFDLENGNTVVPRGNDYVRLAPQFFGGQTLPEHSTFNPGLYDPARSDAALSQMQTYGYNVVKVWLNTCCMTGSIGNGDLPGLSQVYLANLADFLTRAKSHGISVILTADDLPPGYFQTLLAPYFCCPYDLRWNYLVMDKTGIAATILFWQELAQGLIAAKAPMDAIFAYQTREELFYRDDLPPLSNTSGTYTPANGKTYDLSDPVQKRALKDDSMVFWANQIRTAIQQADPQALVGVGYAIVLPGPGSYPPFPAIASSSVDFVDLHPYLGQGYTLADAAAGFGMAGFTPKPIMMGEFGAPEGTFATTASAALALHDWQVSSCPFGFGAWLLWTWDTEASEQVGPPFWSALSVDGAINQSLAPVNRPNACQN